MDNLGDILRRATAAPRALTADELAALLALAAPDEVAALRAAAYEVKTRHVGRVVSLRGLVEAGNVCAKNCYYCGIRRGNKNIGRFQLTKDEILRAAEDVVRMRYGSLVLQSGETESETHTEFIEDVLISITRMTGGGLGVTLSLGEQSPETYRRWREAGARRYLLRIETSDPALYATLHPATHSYGRRLACLRSLRECGYQVGSGVMCGLPGQDFRSLARDIGFFAEMDFDMLGTGPYIPHRDTPMGRIINDESRIKNYAGSGKKLKNAGETESFIIRHSPLLISLNMISVARLYLHDVNIASTTALQTLAPDGREQGLLAGANVIMPNVTDTSYRRRYQLYDGKPGLDENSGQIRGALAASIARIGETINWDTPGDSPHFAKRVESVEKTTGQCR